MEGHGRLVFAVCPHHPDHVAGSAKGTVLGVCVFTMDFAGAEPMLLTPEERGEWLITPDMLSGFLVRLLELCPISSGVYKGISTLVFSWAGLKYILSLFLRGCGIGTGAGLTALMLGVAG